MSLPIHRRTTQLLLLLSHNIHHPLALPQTCLSVGQRFEEGALEESMRLHRQGAHPPVPKLRLWPRTTILSLCEVNASGALPEHILRPLVEIP